MNLEFIANKIKSLEDKGDTRGISSFKRKNPTNLKEAFSADGENALYDPELINEQLDKIIWRKDLTERGNLEWKDGYEFERPVFDKDGKPVMGEDGKDKYVLNEIVWKPNFKGKFEKIIDWMPKDANKVFKNGTQYRPNNNFAFRVGADPFKYDKTKDKRRSNCAGFLYQIKDELDPDNYFNDTFTLRYAFRESSTKLANMDILKMVWWAGCQVLFERNINHWEADFKVWNCSAFLMILNGETEPGIYTDGQQGTVQLVCNYTEAYINENIKKVFFAPLLQKETGWLGFKVEDTQKFDEPMAAGFTLIAVKGKRYSKHKNKAVDIENIMPYKKAI
jgi:hypothetical protein